MARYTGADCRLCRREGAKLFLKGDRCYTEKCAIERRNYAPGEAGKKRIKESEYRNQLREKQKTKRIYGVLEKQFRHYYDMANRQKGVTGENLLRILESRLDNVVYRLGFAKSRAEARQQVRHGHITVNGRRVDIPSFRVKAGDLVAVAPKAKDLLVIKSALISNERVQVPAWLEVDIEKLQGNVLALPQRDQIDLDIREQLIVELYSRGYGYTLGNCMRRVLLSSLDGAKATAIQIEGVQHEFTTAEGVIEDITDIVLNVKGLVFSALNEDIEEATAHVSAEGPCTVTGADLDIPTEFTLVNPEHVIATVADGGQLDMTIRIGVGRGYVSAERNKRTEDPIGVIHVDSLFSPVRRCTLNVTDTRVGQRTDYDKLVLEVETDGSIAPSEAVCRAANIINQYMGAFLGLSDIVDEEEGEVPSIFAPEGQESNAELDKQIEDLDLSVRSYNCLKRAGIHSVRQLVEFSENDLLNIRNFGAKSIEEVKDKLISMDLNLKL